MKITIFWAWYVWIITWVCLADIWHNILFVDIDKDKINRLNSWKIGIYELWLSEKFSYNKKKWNIRFSYDSINWIKFWDIIISTISLNINNNETSFTNLEDLACLFWKYIDRYKIFINKTTSFVWTLDKLEFIINKYNKKDIEFDLIYNPEFLSEGSAINDFMYPDRIICWINNSKVKKIINKLYGPITNNWSKIFFTDIKSSELIKQGSNSFLATKISFINELANYSELVWWNIKDISYWIWLDSRIWNSFLNAWCWYWGSCLSKDINWLIEDWLLENFNFKIIKKVEEINNNQKILVINKLQKHLDINNKIITILWLSFKPNTDDLRNSPCIPIINNLLKLWVNKIKVFDPIAMKNAKLLFNNNQNIIFSYSVYDSVKKSDAIIFLTEWDEFCNLDLKNILSLMNNNLIIDWRNMFNKKEVKRIWFIYEWIGFSN